MHMADALISPAVGGTMFVAASATVGYSIKKVQKEIDEKKIPLMGVMGAFVFAAQMINFTIPGTGSSGHIAGGILLAALLGPYAGFLTIASIILIQALFFGDGGLLALGCNIFNMGFYACFIAYPLIFRRFISKEINPKKILGASVLSSVLALQMGAFSVVLQTALSGKTELPFSTFVMLMQPIHLAIGTVEGLITAAIVSFVWKARPEIITMSAVGKGFGNIPIKKVLVGLAVAVVLVGGLLSWFASSNPDGLEWSMEKTAGTTELTVSGKVHEAFASIQSKTAFLPDYGFKSAENDEGEVESSESEAVNVDAGTSVSGIVGALITLMLVVLVAYLIRGRFSTKVVSG